MQRDKAALVVGKLSLLARVVKAVAPLAEHLILVDSPDKQHDAISARQALLEPLLADNQALLARTSLVHDTVWHEGPLAGIQAGLAAAQQVAELAFITSCDVPLLQTSLVELLVDRLICPPLPHEQSQAYDAAIPEIGGQMQPLTAVYRTALAASAAANFAAGNRRVKTWAESLRWLAVTEPALRAADKDLRSLKNINTPAQLLEIESLLERED